MKRLHKLAILLLCCSASLFVFVWSASLFRELELFPVEEPILTKQETAISAAALQQELPSSPATLHTSNWEEAYYIKKLDADTQRLCAIIYQGIAEFEEEITLPTPVSSDVLGDIMWLISYDCPELFQVNGRYSYCVRENEPDLVLSIIPVYVMTQQAYESALERIQSLLSQWVGDANGGSAYDIELALYQNLIKTCSYMKDGTHAGSAYGALIEGKARCEGYAKALCLALRTAGMESLILTGEARTSASNEEERTEKHAWNAVEINGAFYQLDATWDDPECASSFATAYAYFNLTDEEMQRNHTVDDICMQWPLPVCDDASMSYHMQVDSFIPFDQEIGEALQAMLDAAYANERNYIIGKFESDLQMEAFHANLKQWLANWYHSKKFSTVSYQFLTYADSRIFVIFNLNCE